MCCAVLAACTGAPSAGPIADEPEGDVVWPPPPAPARIRWEGTFALPRDLGVRPTFLTRAQRLLFGGPDDRLVRPQGIAVVDRRIYLTDPGTARVLIYDLEKKRFTALDANADHPWQVPISVAALQDGTLFVVDAAGPVYRVDPQLRRAEVLNWPGLKHPVAVAVDEARDRIYILDAHRHQVRWGRLDGRYRGVFGRRGAEAGRFNFPTHLAVRSDGGLYITDAMNFRVQHLQPDGQVRSFFGQGGDGTGDFAKPKGVAVDSAGTIYVVDALYAVVQLFDADGRFLMHFGAAGRGRGEFWLPTGIAIDASDRIYVADSYNRRVQIFARVGDAS